ncbi:MAG TPA: DUF624 domain-containing protein [Clostridiales bacterium]|jgi:uncharacterized membrane protein YesL|nr:DUF624 domain-containing protein [Clostridiales bacterium]
MRMKPWLEWSFIKEGVKNLFWNFHYLLLYGIFTLVSIAGIITAGVGITAMASSIRVAAMDEKLTVRLYFAEWKRHLKPGLLLSLLLILILASFWSSLHILSWNKGGLETSAAYAGIAVSTVIAFFSFYYPFAAFDEVSVRNIFFKSVVYTIGHFWDTIVQLSILLIIWKILAISPVFLVLLYLPLSFYIINRFIIANNREVECKKTS